MNSLVPPPLQRDDAPTSRRKRMLRIVLVLATVAIMATGAWYAWKEFAQAAPSAETAPTVLVADTDTMARAPLGVRIKVRVVNTTKTDGMAKKATGLLRDRGFDVVDYEGDARNSLDSTLVLTHSGHDDWSARIVRALGVGSVQSRPDSSRYLDITVLIGRDWKAPSQPFRP